MPCSSGRSSRLPATDPDAERSGLQMRHRVGHDRKAGGKTRDFDAHAAAPSCAARLTERIWRSTAIWSTGSAVTRSGRLIEVGRAIREAAAGRRRRPPRRRETWPGGQCPAPPSESMGSRVSFSATATPTAVWGSMKWPVSRSTVRMVAAVSSSSARSAENTARMPESARTDSANRRDWASEAISARTARRLAAVNVEQQALEIRRHLDIHGGRGSGHHLAQIVGAGRDCASEDVVDVGGDHQAIDGQAHAERDIARIDVAEIAGRHGEGNLAARRAERDGGGEVIDHLCDDARPVDGIYARQPRPVAKRGWLNMPFTIAWQSSNVPSIASAWTFSSSTVVIMRRCTSEMRPCGNSTKRSTRRATAERLDRGAAGVARGRDHDGGALPARREHLVHEPAKELHGQILERERRARETARG